MEIDLSLWERATARYKEHGAQRSHTERSTDQPAVTDRAEVETAAQELDSFLNSAQGATALALLAASHQHIIIAQGEPGGGYVAVYYIDGTGLHRSIEATGMWVAYTQAPPPQITPATAHEAVWEAVLQGTQAKEVLPEVILNLNAIAAKVAK